MSVLVVFVLGGGELFVMLRFYCFPICVVFVIKFVLVCFCFVLTLFVLVVVVSGGRWGDDCVVVV